MIKSFILKMLLRYQWLFNPRASRSHEISVLLGTHHFEYDGWKKARYYNIFYDGGRFLGSYTQVIGGLFPTHVQVVMYERVTIPEGKHKDRVYRALVVFSHKLDNKKWRTNSRISTEFGTFSEINTFLKNLPNMAQSRGNVFEIMQKSKKNPIPVLTE